MQVLPSHGAAWSKETLRSYQRASAGFSVTIIVAIACLAAAASVGPAIITTGAFTDRPAAPEQPAVAPPLPPLPVRQPAGASSGAVLPVDEPFLPAVPWRDAGAEATLAATLEGWAGVFGVAVIRPSDGRMAFVNEDEVFYAASTFKLAVLYEVVRRYGEGRLDLSAPLPISAAAIAEDDGTYSSLPFDENGDVSMGDALRAMVTISDTVTANAFMELFTHEAIDETLRGLGLETMSVNTRELPTTAEDLARLMAAIVTGDGLTSRGRALALDLLLDQRWRDGIPAGLPDGVTVGNKTGNVPGSTHDVAFVEGEQGTYIIAVLSDRSWDWNPMVDISERAWDLFGGATDSPSTGGSLAAAP